MRRFTVLWVGAAMAALLLAVAGRLGLRTATPQTALPPGPAGAPYVLVETPEDGTMGVDRDANIKAKFSERMRARTINRWTFLLYEGNISYVDINSPSGCNEECPIPPPLDDDMVSYKAEKKLAVLNCCNPRTSVYPTGRLLPNTQYTAVVEGAGDFDGYTVKDRAGNEMASDYIWHFTTGAN